MRKNWGDTHGSQASLEVAGPLPKEEARGSPECPGSVGAPLVFPQVGLKGVSGWGAGGSEDGGSHVLGDSGWGLKPRTSTCWS